MTEHPRVKEITRQLFGGGRLHGAGIGSHNRLEALLRLTRREPPDVFWGVMADAWSACDDTWHWQSWLLSIMRDQPARPHVVGLTYPLRIYRGWLRQRVRGMSWTTDRKIAEGFARGHRFIPVPDPVIAEAVVERPAVFLAIDERGESEVLIDPRRLRRLKVHTYAPATRTEYEMLVYGDTPDQPSA